MHRFQLDWQILFCHARCVRVPVPLPHPCARRGRMSVPKKFAFPHSAKYLQRWLQLSPLFLPAVKSRRSMVYPELAWVRWEVFNNLWIRVKSLDIEEENDDFINDWYHWYSVSLSPQVCRTIAHLFLRALPRVKFPSSRLSARRRPSVLSPEEFQI